MIKVSTRDAAQVGIMSALLIAGKAALSFLPNVEVVTFLIILYTLHFGGKVFFSIFIFIAVEYMIWGFNLWSVMYIYIWPLLALCALIFRSRRDTMFWAVFSAVFGLIFGGLCSLVYIFAGGIKAAVAWWIAGIPFDIIHCISNFVLTMVLYRPLSYVMENIK